MWGLSSCPPLWRDLEWRIILSSMQWRMHALTCALGVILGWAFFRLPEPACGPLVWERTPEWLGVGIAAIAAYATFRAIRVGLLSAERAITAERQLRDRERLDAAESRQRQARILAGVAFQSLVECLGQLQEIAECYKDVRFQARHADLMHIKSKIRHAAIGDIAGRPELFDPDDGIAFGSAKTALDHTSLIAGENAVQFAKWDSSLKARMWIESASSLEYTINALKEAIVRAGIISDNAVDFERINEFAKECAGKRAHSCFGS